MINGSTSSLNECACVFIVKKEWINDASTIPGIIECPRIAVRNIYF